METEPVTESNFWAVDSTGNNNSDDTDDMDLGSFQFDGNSLEADVPVLSISSTQSKFLPDFLPLDANTDEQLYSMDIALQPEEIKTPASLIIQHSPLQQAPVTPVDNMPQFTVRSEESGNIEQSHNIISMCTTEQSQRPNIPTGEIIDADSPSLQSMPLPGKNSASIASGNYSIKGRLQWQYNIIIATCLSWLS